MDSPLDNFFFVLSCWYRVFVGSVLGGVIRLFLRLDCWGGALFGGSNSKPPKIDRLVHSKSVTLFLTLGTSATIGGFSAATELTSWSEEGICFRPVAVPSGEIVDICVTGTRGKEKSETLSLTLLSPACFRRTWLTCSHLKSTTASVAFSSSSINICCCVATLAWKQNGTLQ